MKVKRLFNYYEECIYSAVFETLNTLDNTFAINRILEKNIFLALNFPKIRGQSSRCFQDLPFNADVDEKQIRSRMLELPRT
jgi:hypothetical protein